MVPQFECPRTLPTEWIGKFPLATVSRSTLYQHCYMNSQEKLISQTWKIMRVESELPSHYHGQTNSIICREKKETLICPKN